ncbi:MAG: class I SAM-dependent methyltransferase, partial [Bacteroidales bacterium]|nr:class I SAM-dependent methyltransferase [Bacteroidales bacterium]
IKVVTRAYGTVLEVGIGSGLNLPFYSKEHVKHLTAIDPSKENWNKNTVNIESLPFEFEFIVASAESIPADDNSCDTVVITYTLCTIPDYKTALSEIRRVLKKGGKLLFCEHGKAPERAIQIWQNIINPFWKCVGGGCNLNRDMPLIIEENGFKITRMETKYIHGWKPGGYNYWGEAKI